MHPFPKDRSVPIHRTFHLSLTAAAGLLLAAFGSTSAPADDAVPAATPAQPPGQPPAAGPPAPADSKVPTTLKKVVVSADLNQAREDIAPALGATGYAIAPSQIEVVPGGSNAPLQQVLLRAPGVVEDSWGQEHVRGEHANLTYRVNGVLLPEPLSGFGQELDTQLIHSVNLITGSLPAQFGFHTAGIVDVLTKSGESLSGSDLSIYGGSFSTIRPSFETGGTSGPLDYFVTGSYSHDTLGIENPTSSRDALHDVTDQERLFGYFSRRLDDTSRVTLLMNAYDGDFQIPNSPGVAPAFTLNGISTADSRAVDENQNEQQYYAVLAYQKSACQLSTQISAFARYGAIDFKADRFNDMIFQGVAGDVRDLLRHGRGAVRRVADRDEGDVRVSGDTLEDHVVEAIRLEVDRAVPGEGRDLRGQLAGRLLVREDRVVLLSVLVLVDRARVGGRDAVEGEGRGHARGIGNVEVSVVGVHQERHAARVVEAAREVARQPLLIGDVVEGVARGRRILDAQRSWL